MKYAFFIGCTALARGVNYETSARKIAQLFNIELIDVPSFGCCGYPVTHSDHLGYLALAARNLAEADKRGMDIVTICNACTGALTKARNILLKDEKERNKVNSILKPYGLEFSGISKVKHFSRVLYEDVGIEKLKERVKISLEGWKCAAHYGCHYVKPSELFENFDDAFMPRTLDMLIEVTGAKSVEYQNKMLCCGGGVLAVKEKISTTMTKEKLDNIKSVNADLIVLQCPFCAIMYDEYQGSIGDYNIPILYITQLLGLSFGLDAKKELGFSQNAVKAKKLMQFAESKKEASK